MLMDRNTRFSQGQSVAAAAGDVVSTDVIDIGSATDIGIGDGLDIMVTIGTAVTSGGAATLQPVLQTADDVSFSTNLTEYPLRSALALTALTANTNIYVGRLPVGLRRFIRIVYRIGTATTTAGTVSTHIVLDSQAVQYPARAYTV
jgi:hypothetical protein